ncbi:MAG: hypothetical protein WB809_08115 [Thermoplasmata archaeon]
MRTSRLVMIAWAVLIGLLLIVELAEITHLFTLPVESAVGDPLVFVLALVFTTIVALVGAIFIGIYISARILSPSGFTPFEEEMLRMRTDLTDVKAAVEELRRGPGSPAPPRSGDEEDDP